MLWSFIRNRTRDAVLAGVNDALAELDGPANGELTEAAGLLRARLQLALPAPPEPADIGPASTPKRKRGE